MVKCLSWPPLSSIWPTSTGRASNGRRTQSLKQKPKPHRQFEDEDRAAVNPNGDDLRELGKNDEREPEPSHQKGREHSPASQCSRNKAGLEPQIAEGGAPQTSKYQADVIGIVMRTDRQPRQRLHTIRFECLQVASTAQDPQYVEVSQGDDDQDGGLYQPPTQGQ